MYKKPNVFIVYNYLRGFVYAFKVYFSIGTIFCVPLFCIFFKALQITKGITTPKINSSEILYGNTIDLKKMDRHILGQMSIQNNLSVQFNYRKIWIVQI